MIIAIIVMTTRISISVKPPSPRQRPRNFSRSTNIVIAFYSIILNDQPKRSHLALLWHFLFDVFSEEHLTMRASQGWRPCEEVEDRLPDGRHAWLWRRSCDSFFSVPLL